MTHPKRAGWDAGSRSLRRREFLGAAAGALTARAAAVEGSVLVHEHIMVDFIGADQIEPGRYDPEEVIAAAKPKLEEVKALGCRRLLECTPNFLGRDAALMQRLAAETGIEIWTNTGLYAAANHKYLPAFAKEEPPHLLADRWIREAREGVDGVLPRFVKIGVNKAPLHPWDRKIVTAAALTSRETGLTVASHTGDGRAALEQIDIFESLRVSPAKFVWVHAQNEKDHDFHEQAAREGAWVEFDGVRRQSADWHLECVRFLAGKGLLGQVLISQDSGWYRVGEEGGGRYDGYTYIYTDFLPRLEEAWVRRLMVENPVEAFGN
jgi:phosphotriesterase-related protein